MAIPPTGRPNNNPAAKALLSAQELAQTPVQLHKTTLNIAIMKSSEASISVKDQPLALLLRTAIDNLNERLGSEPGPKLDQEAIQKAAVSDIDFSPQGTADRIVELSTGFYDSFKMQHSGEDEPAVLQKFLDTIGKGIDQGFSDSRNTLAGLDVLDGDVARTIDETYSLVQLGITAFEVLLNQSNA